jgi:hypothetical protein
LADTVREKRRARSRATRRGGEGADVTAPSTPGADGPPYFGAALAALGAFALYALTLAPTIAFWDTSEYIATAHIMGIPHPPGNPLFVALAKAWSTILAPTGLSVAVRINLLAAITSACATGFLFLVAHRVLRGFVDDRRFALVGASVSALLGATAFTVWNQSNVNEKVYTVSMLVIGAVSWLAVRWYDRRAEPGSERLLLWAGFLLILGSTNHTMSVLPGPALLLLVLLAAPSLLIRPAFLGRAALLVVVGLSFNFILPIRASLDPRINEAEPVCTSLTGAAAAIYTNGRSGCEDLGATLTREQYQTPPVTQRKSPFRAQMAMYLQYFDWQWSRGLDRSALPSPLRLPFTVLFFTLGVAGLYVAWRSDRVLFSYVGVLAATLTVGLVVYLNFEYGYSLSPEITDPDLHEVRERDYFFIAGFMFWGCLAGMGLSWMWHTFATALGGARRYAVTAPVLLLAAVPLVFNWPWASRAGDYAAYDWAYDLLMSVEPYAILFTNGDNDTFPLWYMQEVENVRSDVTVIVGQYLYTTWYVGQLKRHTAPGAQRAFDPDLVPGLYEDRPAPTRSIVGLGEEEMNQVGAARLQQDLTIPFPTLAVTYPEGMVLDRSHQLALSIIHDSIDERPIYFSATGGMLNELGLRQWGVRHGLATKLELRSLGDESSAGFSQGSADLGGDWFALEHSLKLYQDVYRYRSILGRPIWQDRATLNIPLQYYAMSLILADAAQENGVAPDVIDRLRRDAVDFQVVGRGGERGAPLQGQSSP